MNHLENLMQKVRDLEADFQKFYDKGQSAAGTRLRKGLNELRKFAQEVRQDVQNVKTQRKSDKS